MLSGCYHTEMLTRHWNLSNSNGYCQAATCKENPAQGDLILILIMCPALNLVRENLFLHDKLIFYALTMLETFPCYAVDEDSKG